MTAGSPESEPPAVAGGSTQQTAKPAIEDFRLQPPATAGGSDKIIEACAAAAEDLKATRVLAEALELENYSLKTRLETEKHATAILLELNETRKSETESLRAAVEAKNETIAAKDAVIANQDKLIETLKNKKTSPLKRIGDILLGAAMIAIFK